MDRSLILTWVGLSLALLGTILTFSWHSILNFMISKELRLTPESRVYSIWRKTPMPLTLDFYFFNWTNPEELMNESSRPNLVEMGPYRFKEYLEKTNVTWNANKTISFRRLRSWIFDAENSNGSLNDNVTTLNPVAVTAAHISRFRNTLLLYTLSSAFRVTGETVWLTKTVREFLYDGYSDPLLTIASRVPHLAQTRFAGEKFAWFYRRNNTSEQDGHFNMETGEEDISRIGLVRSWNFKNRSDFFEDECGEVRGTIGDLYPPGQKKHTSVKMFSAEFCKPLQLDYSEDTEVEGVPGYVYVGSKSLMDNGTADPKNLCNCGGVCVPQGVLNVSSCRYGAPGFVSYPHFLDADPYYRDRIEGMHPERTRHKFYLTLEPTTGIPLEVAARFQINLLLQPNKGIALFHDVPTIFFPMMWFEECVRINPEFAESLRMLLAVPVVGMYCSVSFLLLGLLILAFPALPKIMARTKRSLSRRRKGTQAVERSNQEVFSNENILPLMSPVTPDEGNSKNADVIVK